MKQKSQLTLPAGWLAFFGMLVMVATLAAPAFAQRIEPVVPNIRPPPTGIAPQKIPPRPAPGVVPRRIPPGGIDSTTVRPTMKSPTCRSTCASNCQMVDCSGLNVSRCASVRQNCRVSCSSRC